MGWQVPDGNSGIFPTFSDFPSLLKNLWYKNNSDAYLFTPYRTYVRGLLYESGSPPHP
jgi:hypothetical protein